MKKLNFLALSILLVIAVISGCDDKATGQVISGDVPNIEDADQNQGTVIDIIEEEVPDEEAELITNQEESEITNEQNTGDAVEVIKEESAYPESDEGKTFEIVLDDDFDYGKFKDLYEGDTHLIDIDGVKQKLKLLKVLKNGQMMFEFRGQDTDFLDDGDEIRLDRSHKVTINRGLYNEPWNSMPSLAELVYEREILESYDEYLIEEQIGDADFISSKKEDNTYTARYDYDLTVKVIKNYDFMYHYPDDENLYLYNNDYIYRVKDNLGNIVEIAWLSDDGYTVIITPKSDAAVDRYLKKHNSALTKEMYCTKEVKMIEGESKSFEINGHLIDIDDIIYVNNDDNYKFSINGQFTSRFEMNERIDVVEGVDLVVKEVWPNYSEMNDRIKFCFLYDEE